MTTSKKRKIAAPAAAAGAESEYITDRDSVCQRYQDGRLHEFGVGRDDVFSCPHCSRQVQSGSDLERILKEERRSAAERREEEAQRMEREYRSRHRQQEETGGAAAPPVERSESSGSDSEDGVL